MQEGEIVKVVVDGKVCEAIEIKELYLIEDMLIDALCADGAHHKQWYLCQIAKKFGLDVGSITHDTGIAP